MSVKENIALKTMQIEMSRVDGDFHFAALGSDKVAVHIDAAAAVGGTHQGARPMELILKKARQVVEDLKIVVEGDREDGATPAPFVNLRLKYIFKGNLKPEKVEQAIKLSMEKYCSVTTMLEKSAAISWSFEIKV